MAASCASGIVRLSLASCHSRAASRLPAPRLVASISSRPRRLPRSSKSSTTMSSAGMRRRLRVEQALDALGLALGQAEAREPRVDAAGAGRRRAAPAGIRRSRRARRRRRWRARARLACDRPAVTLVEAARADGELADAQARSRRERSRRRRWRRRPAARRAAPARRRAPRSPCRRASAACHASTSSRFSATLAATPLAGSGSARSGRPASARRRDRRRRARRRGSRRARRAPTSPLASRTNCACSSAAEVDLQRLAQRRRASPARRGAVFGAGADAQRERRRRRLGERRRQVDGEADEVARDADLRPAGDEARASPR